MGNHGQILFHDCVSGTFGVCDNAKGNSYLEIKANITKIFKLRLKKN